ncbi:hypothetical protein J6590_053450, partial [Homalodisca vitripennis]
MHNNDQHLGGENRNCLLLRVTNPGPEVSGGEIIAAINEWMSVVFLTLTVQPGVEPLYLQSSFLFGLTPGY